MYTNKDDAYKDAIKWRDGFFGETGDESVKNELTDYAFKLLKNPDCTSDDKKKAMEIIYALHEKLMAKVINGSLRVVDFSSESEKDEVVSFCYSRLEYIVKNYDASKQIKFSTYLASALKHSLWNAVNKISLHKSTCLSFSVPVRTPAEGSFDVFDAVDGLIEQNHNMKVKVVEDDFDDEHEKFEIIKKINKEVLGYDNLGDILKVNTLKSGVARYKAVRLKNMCFLYYFAKHHKHTKTDYIYALCSRKSRFVEQYDKKKIQRLSDRYDEIIKEINEKPDSNILKKIYDYRLAGFDYDEIAQFTGKPLKDVLIPVFRQQLIITKNVAKEKNKLD